MKEPDSDSHVMASLPGGKYTCTCNTIQASADERDIFIHIEWALREQIKQLRERG